MPKKNDERKYKFQMIHGENYEKINIVKENTRD